MEREIRTRDAIAAATVWVPFLVFIATLIAWADRLPPAVSLRNDLSDSTPMFPTWAVIVGVGIVLVGAERGDPAAVDALDEYARMLAFAVRSVVAVIDPSRVVLTGGLGSSDLVIGRLRLHLDDSTSRRVIASELGADSPAHGAMLLALRAASSPVPLTASSTIT